MQHAFNLWSSVLHMAPHAWVSLVLVVLSAVSALLLGRRRRSTVPGPLFTLPLVGETAELVWRGPGAFFLDRYRRYGGIYRTNVLGIQDMYCVLEPSLARTLLRGDGTSFVAPFESISQLIGDTGHMVDGPTHNYFRKIFSTSTSPAAIERLLPRMTELLGRHLAMLEAAGRQSIFDVGSDLAAELALQVVVGLDLQHTDRSWFKETLLQYIAGMFTVLPFNVPGFAFHHALKAKAKLLAAMEVEFEHSAQAMLAEDPDSGAGADVIKTGGETFRRAYVQAQQAAAEPAATAAERQAKERACVNAMVADSMRRLNEKTGRMESNGSSGRIGKSSNDVAKVADQAAAASSIVAGVGAAGSGKELGTAGQAAGEAAAVANLVDANLEVLRGQKMLSAASAASRVLGVFFAAVDTTRNSLMTVLGLLAELPEEADKLRAEQDKLIAEHGEAITPAVLAGATYLDAFCREAMRMLPAARVGLRAALKDLHWAGHVIPKGATLLYSIDCLHALDPVMWDGKYGPPGTLPSHMDFQHNLRGAFQPDRWLSDATRPKHSFTFSSGSHLCLGLNLVYTELKVLTALMVRGGYSVSFDKPGMLQHMKLFPTMRPPPDNCHVRIQRPAVAAVN